MIAAIPKQGLKDYSLNSGERQVANQLSGIRCDHRIRYQFAGEVIRSFGIEHQLNILDLFCGNGYGSYMLAQMAPNAHVNGMDASAEAIKAANEHYKLSNNCFTINEFPFDLPRQAFDVVVSFESLEHVQQGEAFIDTIVEALRPGGKLFLSAPNNEIHDLAKNPHKFHFKHYCTAEIRELFSGRGNIDGVLGQNVYHFDEQGGNTHQLLPESLMGLQAEEGQVNVYVITRK